MKDRVITQRSEEEADSILGSPVMGSSESTAPLIESNSNDNKDERCSDSSKINQPCLIKKNKQQSIDIHVEACLQGLSQGAVI